MQIEYLLIVLRAFLKHLLIKIFLLKLGLTQFEAYLTKLINLHQKSLFILTFSFLQHISLIRGNRLLRGLQLRMQQAGCASCRYFPLAKNNKAFPGEPKSVCFRYHLRCVDSRRLVSELAMPFISRMRRSALSNVSRLVVVSSTTRSQRPFVV